MRSTLLAAIGLACCHATPAAADDSSAALGAGGLVLTKSADIRMADEDLYISPKQVRVRFAFTNDSGKDIDAILAFVLPDLDMAEFTNSPLGTVTDDPENFVGFSVREAGSPVTFSIEQRAYAGGRDVTDIVKSTGLPLNVVAAQGYQKLEALPAAKRKVLTAAHIAEFDDNNNALPGWTVRTRFYWRQHFPAGKTVVLDQAYQPVTGQAFFSDMELNRATESGSYYASNFCLDADTRATLSKRIARLKAANPQNGGLLNVFTTNYILMTGNNWKGPIGHFRFTLDKLKPDNVLSLCWDGGLKKTGATTFESARDLFHPRRDIRLLVFETPAH